MWETFPVRPKLDKFATQSRMVYRKNPFLLEKFKKILTHKLCLCAL